MLLNLSTPLTVSFTAMNSSHPSTSRDGTGFFFKNVQFNHSRYYTIKKQTSGIVSKLSEYNKKLTRCNDVHGKMCKWVTTFKTDLVALQQMKKQVDELITSAQKLADMACNISAANPNSLPLKPTQKATLVTMYADLTQLDDLKQYSDELHDLITDLQLTLPSYQKIRDKYYQQAYYLKKKIVNKHHKLYHLTEAAPNAMQSFPSEIWFLIFSHLYSPSTQCNYVDLKAEHATHANVSLTCKLFNRCMTMVHQKHAGNTPYDRLVAGWGGLGPKDLMFDANLYFVRRLSNCTLVNSVSYTYLNYLFQIDEVFRFTPNTFTKQFNNVGFLHTSLGHNFQIKFRKSLRDHLGSDFRRVESTVLHVLAQSFPNTFMYAWLLLGKCIFRIDPELNCTIYYNRRTAEFESCPENLSWHKDIKQRVLFYFPDIAL